VVGDIERQLVTQARYHDLVVIARRTRPKGESPFLLGRLLVYSGRPLLIVPTETGTELPGSVLVCWRDTPEAAHAVTAAMPLLVKGRRVILATAGEVEPPAMDGLTELAGTLARHGIAADTEWIATGSPPGIALLQKAHAENVGLMVLGGYGHSRMHETLFGGVTQTILDNADIPVLMAH
jgi:nucleotide-binding universal stress UspA family protein